MERSTLPPPDKNGIIRALPKDLSEVNKKRIGKFGIFMSLYDFVQDKWVRPRIHKANPKKHREIMQSAIAPVKNADVLDLACGTGAAIPHFDSSDRYTGLDLSYAMLKQAIKKARAKGFPEFTLVEGNAEELLFASEHFDFVLIDTSLHMIPQYQMCMAETARVLKKGGTLVCSSPTIGINEDFDALWAKISPKRYLHSLRESDYQAVCSGNGLAYERVGTNGGMFYFRAQKKES
jgi:ubiquinone/menaquinone biosynthesis C-methylase UbiE